jgi:hypothetical protein
MIYLLLCFYAHVHGYTNAFLYGRKGADSLPGNEHVYLTIERAAVWLLPIIACLQLMLFGYFLTFRLGVYSLVLELVAGAMAFSFFHNGAYYLMRDRIDGTSHGFCYQSPTSTAVLEFSYTQRAALFYLSCALLGFEFGQVVYKLFI